MNRLRSVLSILILSTFSLLAQNAIRGGEYWIDGDFEGRIPLTLASSGHLTYESGIDVSALIDGVHVIHYRFMDDNRIWSSVLSRFFLKERSGSGTVTRELVSYEYWLDGDFDNRQEKFIGGTQDLSLLENLDVSLLKSGLHMAHYRFRDSEGLWSGVLSKYFVVAESSHGNQARDLVAYEYWFDTDFENRSAGSIGHLADLSLNEDLDVSGLREGLHTVHYRFLDSAHLWSSVVTRFIVCKGGEARLTDNRIVAYRYWIDGAYQGEVAWSDPGRDVQIQDTLEMYEYRKGDYRLSLQFRDEQGYWSSPVSDSVEKLGYPIAAVTAPGGIVCDTATLEFQSTSFDADTLIWTVNNVEFWGDTGFSHFFSQTGTYEVGLIARDTMLHIDSTVHVSVIVDSVEADLIAGQDFRICEGDSRIIETVPGYSYVWNTGETSQNIIAQNQQWYVVEASTSLGCIGLDSVFLEVHENPVIYLGEDQSIPETGSLVLDAGPGYSAYLWSDNSAQQYLSLSGETLGIGDHLVYVEVWDANNCSGSDTITISVTSASGLALSDSNGIRMYPVPVGEHLTIEIPGTMLGTSCRIYNATGVLVGELLLENEISRVHTDPFPPGYYMFAFIHEGQRYQRVVVVSK